MIYIGIDDTDVLGSPGTNQLARAIVRRLGPLAQGAIVCRHQLFFDPRVPYTSQNGSASIQLPRGDEVARDELVAVVREVMREWYVHGSDPGLAVAAQVTGDMTAFAVRAKHDVVTQDEARAVADGASCHLEGLGGTKQGIIGALSAVALAYGGDDGRVVHADDWPWPDELCGPQPIGAIRGRGVDDVRLMSGDAFIGDVVDVGKHLRPNWRGRRMVLFVEPGNDGAGVFRAVKLK